MKSCEEFESRISSWVDGEFDVEERLEVLDHFARCPGCRRFYLEARALDGLVAGIAPAAEPLPRELWERIAARAGQGTSSSPARRSIPAWALSAAALLALTLGLGFWTLRRGAEPEIAATPTEIEVLLEQDGGEMSESRFVELTTEVLRADRRFHRAMLEVMEQVVADTASERSSEGGDGLTEERREEGGERNTRSRDLA